MDKVKELSDGTKNQQVLQAVKSLQKSQFGDGVTAIKVELEAQLSRGRGGCDESHTCDRCDGDWEDAEECPHCDASGYYREVNGDWENCAEDDEGAIECDECLGSGMVSCDYCEEGYVECDGCDSDEGEFGSDDTCHDFIMAKLAELGLAEQGDMFSLSHDTPTTWHPIGALRYAEFYRDGSVDSEFTFTIMLDNPENIFLLPKIIAIWNEFCRAVGNGVDINGAGMHMALLETADGSYGHGYSIPAEQYIRFSNFQASMQLLLPALYCLGASNGNSRGLDYRQPCIQMDSHRAAVDYRNGALEFRIFDTCYDNPDQILDNVVVISKCMRYWADKKVDSGMAKITARTTFGGQGGRELDRFYCRVEHIDLLNQGLRKLKPGYYTITDIKQQRQMKISKHIIGARLRQFRKQAELEYKEYVERFDLSLKVLRFRRMADFLERAGQAGTDEDAESYAKTRVELKAKERQSLDRYLERRLEEFNRGRGDYTLCAE